jgi:hypothetical protein
MKAQQLLKRISDLQEVIAQWEKYWQEATYIGGMLEMSQEENDALLYNETVFELEQLEKIQEL